LPNGGGEGGKLILTTSSSVSAGAGVDASGLSVTGGQTITSINNNGASINNPNVHRDILLISQSTTNTLQ